MDTWLIALLIVVGAFLLRGVVFIYLLWRADTLLVLLMRYWKEEVTFGEAGDRKREIVRLFRVAQVPEPGIDLMTPTLGGVMHRQAGLFNNVFLRRGDVQQLVFDSFTEAIGYFRDEIRRSFIPVFWPSVVINLPADALVYMGVRPGAAAVRVTKVVTAVAGLVVAVAGLWRLAS